MRERDRTLSIQKKKLLKTTTFSVVLLSAAIMVLSGAVSAINLNMNSTQMNDIIINNSDKPVTADMSDFTGGMDHSNPGWQGVKALNKDLEYRSARASYIVYDNEPTDWNYYVASYIDNVQYGWDELIADDFLMWTPAGEEWCIDDVHWTGIYYTPWTGGFNYDDESALDWVIEFYEDDGTGNAPGDLYAGPYTYTFDEIGTTLLGYSYSGSYLVAEFFDMSVDLPESICFPGCGEKFWISIYGLGDTYWLFTAVGMRDYDIFNNMADFKSDYYGYPDWVPTVDAYGIPLELAFALTAKIDYDAMTVSVDVDTDGFCGCVPVVATVKNDGKYDLVDVPVHVTITPGGYDETILVDLGVGEEIEVAFPDFCPVEWGTVEFTTICYVATACTELVIDMYPANDCKSTAFCLDFPAFHDVGGVAIQVTDDGCLNYEFCGTIENFGQYQECCFKTYLTVEKETQLPDIWVPDQPAVTHFEEDFDDPWVGTPVPGLTAPYTGTYELALQDAYGDGMNGGYVDVYVNAVQVIFAATLVSGYGPVWFSFSANAGDQITADYTPMSYPSENYYAITDDTVPTTIFFETGGSGFVADYTTPVDLGGMGPPFNPAGWTQTGFGEWKQGTTSHSAPTSAYHTYTPFQTYDDWLISPVVVIAGYTSTDVSWWSYKGLSSWYDFHGVYVSLDGAPFTLLKEDVHTTDYTWVQSTETVDLTGASTIQIAFRYMGYDADYWYLDDVLIGNAFIPGHWIPGPLEYTTVFSEWYCIDTIDPCEQQTFCFDGTWTPENGPNCESETYRITIETELCDPMDEVPSNDAYSEFLDVEFKHDIEVTITSPVPNKADLLFEQIVHDSTDSWSMGTSDAGLGYQMHEDFWGLTDLIGEVNFDALVLSWTGSGWTAGNPATLGLDVGFYAAGAVPGAEEAYFADVAFTYTPGQLYSGYQAYNFHMILPGVVDLTDGWVSIQSQSAAGENVILWCSAKTGNGQSYQAGASVPMTLYDRALKIYSGQGVSIAGYFPCGEMDLCANIANIGTFDEVDDPSSVCYWEGIVVYYELHQYVQTDPCEDPEDIIVASGMEELELLCGEETEICFTYDFTESGVYGLFMWAELYPVDLDCDLDNNLDIMGFGIDCCPPVSEHTLNPTMPGGNNNWYLQDVTVTITATDPLCPDPCLGTASGVKEIHYKINGVETVKADDSVTFKISAQGVNLVEYWAVDEAGNAETHFTFEIAIDKVKPTVDLIFEKIEDGTLQVKFTAIASDATSGIAKVEFYRDTTLLTTMTAAPFVYTITWEDAFKTSTFKAKAYDGAGNTAEDTVFGGDIPGAKAFVNSVAQNLAQIHVHALTQQI
jgi:hypothetical protein